MEKEVSAALWSLQSTTLLFRVNQRRAKKVAMETVDSKSATHLE